MNKGRKIWLATSITIVVVFLWAAPITVLPETSFVYSLIGAAFLFISLTQLFGQFSSLKDLFKKPDKNKPEHLGRYLAPFMVLPSIVFLFVLFFYSGNKKSQVLATNGILVKGIVSINESRKSLTSTELLIQYADSLGEQHSFYHTVLDEDFNSISKGSEVDVIYWKENPDVAKVVLDVSELGKYKKVPNGYLTITNLTSILEGKVDKDSIKDYLNSINYEWTNSEETFYQNSILHLSVQYLKNEDRIALIETMPGVGHTASSNKKSAFSFDQDMIAKGYKKDTSSVGENGKSVELFYSDNFFVQKTKHIEQWGTKVYVVYLISKAHKK